MNNIIHHMTGPFFEFIQEIDGKMYCHDMCDCGCIDNKYEIKEGDTIIAYRPSLIGNLKGLTIHALQFKIYRTAALENCELFARDFDKYPLCSDEYWTYLKINKEKSIRI